MHYNTKEKYMKPDSTINAPLTSTVRLPQDTQNKGSGQVQEQQQNTKIEKISVFSSYDKGQDGKVDSQDASSIFSKMNPAGVTSFESQSEAVKGKLQMFNGNNVKMTFNQLVSKFNVSAHKTLKGADANNEIMKSTAQQDLDGKVENKANKTATDALKTIQQAYNSALKEVQAEIAKEEKENQIKNALKGTPQETLKSESQQPKEVPVGDQKVTISADGNKVKIGGQEQDLKEGQKYEAPKKEPEAEVPKKGPSQHSVVKGNTMSGIAKQYGCSLQELIKANPQIKNPNLIRPGEKINIPTSAQTPPAQETAPKDTPATPKKTTTPKAPATPTAPKKTGAPKKTTTSQAPATSTKGTEKTNAPATPTTQTEAAKVQNWNKNHPSKKITVSGNTLSTTVTYNGQKMTVSANNFDSLSQEVNKALKKLKTPQKTASQIHYQNSNTYAAIGRAMQH